MENILLNNDELTQLCKDIRSFYKNKSYDICNELICDAMKKYPHSPVPHNLLGLILEKTGQHICAMKHFRAAWALDPTYLPARQNLEYYGTLFYRKGNIAFDESDCKDEWL